MSETDVELGFLEPLAPGERPAVESANSEDWDGGKAGGRPTFIVSSSASSVASDGVASVPSAEALACRHCSRPLLFLLQLYAPLDASAGDGVPSSAYHRMLYLWACAAPACTNRPAGKAPSVFALRAQAARGDAVIAARGCALCGLRPRGRCPKCRVSEYCSTAHQAAHWRSGHKEACAPSATAAALESGTSLPEFEIVVEHEPPAAERAARDAARMSPAVSAAVAAASAAPAASATSAVAGGAGPAGGLEDLSISDLTQAKLAKWTGSHLVLDPYMQAFERRVAAEPSQVVRYSRWPAPALQLPAPPASGTQEAVPSTLVSSPIAISAASGKESAAAAEGSDADDDEDAAEEAAEAAAGKAGPLWMSVANQPTEGSIPPCSHCRAPRAFEFQVLPQLIALFASAPGANAASQSLDFGTLAVYTCTRSCDGGATAGATAGSDASHLGSCRIEHVWVQPTNEEEETAVVRARTAAAMRDAAAAELTEEAADEASPQAGQSSDATT